MESVVISEYMLHTFQNWQFCDTAA